MLPYFIKNSWYEISVVFYGQLERVRPGAHVVMTLRGGPKESLQDVRVICCHHMQLFMYACMCNCVCIREQPEIASAICPGRISGFSELFASANNTHANIFLFKLILFPFLIFFIDKKSQNTLIETYSRCRICIYISNWFIITGKKNNVYADLFFITWKKRYSVRTRIRQIVHPNSRICYPVENVYPVVP